MASDNLSLFERNKQFINDAIIGRVCGVAAIAEALKVSFPNMEKPPIEIKTYTWRGLFPGMFSHLPNVS